jgi:hypothetical protein
VEEAAAPDAVAGDDFSFLFFYHTFLTEVVFKSNCNVWV